MQRFQNKKPNKKDHQKIQKVAKNIRNGTTLLTVAFVVRGFIKKHGKDLVKGTTKFLTKL